MKPISGGLFQHFIGGAWAIRSPTSQIFGGAIAPVAPPGFAPLLWAPEWPAPFQQELPLLAVAAYVPLPASVHPAAGSQLLVVARQPPAPQPLQVPLSTVVLQ